MAHPLEKHGEHAHFCGRCSHRCHNGWWSHKGPCAQKTEWLCREHRKVIKKGGPS